MGQFAHLGEVEGLNQIAVPIMLPELLAQIPADRDIASVTADGAYDTRKCHDAIAERDAHAIIPPRKNATPWKATTAGAAGDETLGPCALAMMKWFPPPKPRCIV